jgi:hypothetical protein
MLQLDREEQSSLTETNQIWSKNLLFWSSYGTFIESTNIQIRSRGKKRDFRSAYFTRTSLVLRCTSPVFHSYFTRTSLYFTRISLVLHSYFAVLHPYFTRTSFVLHSYFWSTEVWLKYRWSTIEVSWSTNEVQWSTIEVSWSTIEVDEV